MISPAQLRAARLEAGLTQREVAALVGIAPSNLSAYEAGKRPMSATMADRIEACLRPSPRVLLERNRDGLRELLLERGVRNPRVFGSVARGSDTPGSDIDILVDLGDTITGFGLAALKRDAEQLLGVPVDIVSSGGLRGRFRDRVLREAVPV